MPASAAQPLKRPRAPDVAPPRPPRRPRVTTTTATPGLAPAAPPSSFALPPPTYRVEYGASGPPSSAALAAFLSRHHPKISAVHIANKDGGDRLLERAEALLRPPNEATTAAAAAATETSTPPFEVCLHYSLKLQGARGDEAVRRLRSFLERSARLGGGSRQRVSVLVVSGSGDPAKRPKGQLGAAEALERLASSSPPLPLLLPPIYVAFNPYLLTESEREAERVSLRRKLAAGLVGGGGGGGGVALQFGSDTALLKEGLAFLRQADVLGKEGVILGSLFLPTKRFLAAQRFRPWRGVYLKEGGFLESIERAERCCAATLRLYRRYGVEPLVETALAVEEEEEEESGEDGGGAKKRKAAVGAPSLAAAEELLLRAGEV